MKALSLEGQLRSAAARSALASIRLAGLEPSKQLLLLLVEWTEGTTSLDNVRQQMLEHWRESK
jgi:hypothetical protein